MLSWIISELIAKNVLKDQFAYFKALSWRTSHDQVTNPHFPQETAKSLIQLKYPF